MKHSVSIIMATYNSAQYVEQSIQSIQHQTYQDWNLFITDDGSTDSTMQILIKLAAQDRRIHIFQLSHNSGAGIARNNSLQYADGDYIAFCDSDDRWLPYKLEKQLQLMHEKHCEAVYSSYFTCTDAGEIDGIIHCRPHETAFSIKCDDKMGNLTFMYDVRRIGKHPLPTIRKRQDWAHKMHILNLVHDAYGVQEPLAIYRHSQNSISSKKLSLIKYNIAGFQTLGWSKLKSTVFFFVCFLPTHLCKLISVRRHKHEYTQYL